ncbi:MAG: class I SAM-dependent methyltransferase [Sphingomonadales bacterium]|nr:class I SAM-dependent methyltransferase [Sphingomonadales bacterium]
MTPAGNHDAGPVPVAERARNIDSRTVDGFGDEWHAFDQSRLDDAEWRTLFDRYFSIFPWDSLPAHAEGFDLGCGSGRWARGVAGRVGKLHCIDPSAKALDVARRALANCPQVSFATAAVDAIPLPDGSQDFGYSLGVLHHVPDTEAGLRACVAKLKFGAPFLLYLYYAFDNKPMWFRAVWKVSDLARRMVSQLPFAARKLVTGVLAGLVYWPLARGAALAERLGANVSNLPLSPYRHLTFYSMRTDALDRFGTRLEHRFTRSEIGAMMRRCGLDDIRFREDVPYWVACGRRTNDKGTSA